MELGLWFARGLLVFCFWFILGLLVFCCLRVVSLFPSVCSLVSPFLPLCSRVPCVPFLLRASLSHATGERFGEHFAILAFAVLLVSSAPPPALFGSGLPLQVPKSANAQYALAA